MHHQPNQAIQINISQWALLQPTEDSWIMSRKIRLGSAKQEASFRIKIIDRLRQLLPRGMQIPKGQIWESILPFHLQRWQRYLISRDLRVSHPSLSRMGEASARHMNRLCQSTWSLPTTRSIISSWLLVQILIEESWAKVKVAELTDPHQGPSSIGSIPQTPRRFNNALQTGCSTWSRWVKIGWAWMVLLPLDMNSLALLSTLIMIGSVVASIPKEISRQ